MKKTAIWPSYIDADKTKKQGRKISMKYAVPSPKLSEIKAAAEKLGLAPEANSEKVYPREWWGAEGVVFVEKTKPKTKLIKSIAGEIKKARK